MLITCPKCDTRYDVADERFTPDGRSVRCADCDNSWFVPPPQPVEELLPLQSRNRFTSHDAEAGPQRDFRRDKSPDVARNAAEMRSERRPPYREQAREVDDERETSRRARPRFRVEEPEETQSDLSDDDRHSGRDNRSGRSEGGKRDNAQLGRDSKGRFIKASKSSAQQREEVEQEDDDDALFARVRSNQDVGRNSSRDADLGPRDWRGNRDPNDDDNDSRRNSRQATEIVDADFEDLERSRRPESGQRSRAGKYSEDREPSDDHDRGWTNPAKGGESFGQQQRSEKRRSTALMRIEDLDPVAERVFNDEFFTALRVQPKELERAIRKARRKAEAREKNRLTPWRALGWSAWAGAIAAGLFVAVTYRDTIVAMAPGAAGAYSAVGLKATFEGIKIENVSHRFAMSTTGETIEISGRLINDTLGPVSSPQLQAEALGPDGALLSRWLFEIRDGVVRRGESVDFTTRSPAPEGVAEVVISIAPSQTARVTIGSASVRDR